MEGISFPFFHLSFWYIYLLSQGQSPTTPFTPLQPVFLLNRNYSVKFTLISKRVALSSRHFTIFNFIIIFISFERRIVEPTRCRCSTCIDPRIYITSLDTRHLLSFALTLLSWR